MITGINVASRHAVGFSRTEIRATVDTRLPAFVITGLSDVAAKDTAVRVREAIGAAGYDFPRKRVVVDVPAGHRDHTTGLDLPIALAVLEATEQFQPTEATAYLAELSLAGDLRPVRGALGASRLLDRLVVARGTVLPTAGPAVYGAATLREVIEHREAPLVRVAAAAALPYSLNDPGISGEVRIAIREALAKGARHLTLIGPVGCGKTMVARRIVSELPPMTEAEQLQVWTIHEACGLGASVSGRPFRAPHHTVSLAGLRQELMLAKHGVLLLDEVPEFPRAAIEHLDRNLDGVILVTTAEERGPRVPASDVVIEVTRG